MARSHRVEVSTDFRATVEKWRGANRVSLRRFGEKAALAIGRKRPFGPGAVHAFLQDGIVTEELARAAAAVVGIELPTSTNMDAGLAEWALLGQRLRAHSPDLFAKEKVALERLLDALDRYRSRE